MAKIHIRRLLVLSIVLFVCSLLFPAIYIGSTKPPLPGWHLFLIGPFGILMGEFTWLANPALFIGWILLISARPHRAITFCALTVAIMSSFLFRASMLTDEGGGHAQITGHGIGFWLWLASGTTAIAAALFARAEEKPNKAPEPTTTAGTSAAELPRVPAAVVAHL